MNKIAAVFVLICLVLACSDSVGPSGAVYYLTARVDGSQWRAEGALIDCFHPMYGDSNVLYVSGERLRSPAEVEGLSFLLRDLRGAGTYGLGKHNPADYWVRGGSMATVFGTTTIDTGTLVITNFDSAGRRISGTFQFSARIDTLWTFPPPSDTSLIIKVTNGIFELSFEEK